MNMSRCLFLQRNVFGKYCVGSRPVFLTTNICRHSSTGQEKTTASSSSADSAAGAGANLNQHRTSDLEKKMLVWTKKYPSVDKVPNFVSQSEMERARNKVRIYGTGYMMLATLVVCGIIMYYGKRDLMAGESWAKQNEEWHRSMQEKDKKNK